MPNRCSSPCQYASAPLAESRPAGRSPTTLPPLRAPHEGRQPVRRTQDEPELAWTSRSSASGALSADVTQSGRCPGGFSV